MSMLECGDVLIEKMNKKLETLKQHVTSQSGSDLVQMMHDADVLCKSVTPGEAESPSVDQQCLYTLVSIGQLVIYIWAMNEIVSRAKQKSGSNKATPKD